MGSYLTFLFVFLVRTAILQPNAQEEENPVIRPINHLGAKLHKKLSAEGGNIFFSPTSISAALGMLYYGARGNTAEQMRRTLGFQNSSLPDSDLHLAYQSLMETFKNESSDEYILDVANAALIQKDYPFLPDYKDGLKKIYHASVCEVDFINNNSLLTQEINVWVKRQTHKHINALLNEGELDKGNILVLLNVMYFKGTWKTQFDPLDTLSETFYNQGLETKKIWVPMMHLTENMLYATFNGVKILELPYKGEHISMVVLLPEAMDGLTQLEKELTSDTFKNLRKLTRKTKLLVAFPKFKLEFQRNLRPLLEALGMNVFGGNADFSGISETQPILVSEVIHKAVIEVNEEGSQASAVTYAIVSRSGGQKKEKKIIMDHPFLFAIVDMRSDVILFQGRVEEF